MKKIIYLFIFIIQAYSVATARPEVIDNFIKTMKGKDYIHYKALYKSNNASTGITEDDYECVFKIDPTDSILGYYYFIKVKNIQNTSGYSELFDNYYIYNGQDHFIYSPNFYGENIVKLYTKKNKPMAFNPQEQKYKGKTFTIPPYIKNYYILDYSFQELSHEINKLAERPGTIQKDTIINGISCKMLQIGDDTSKNITRQYNYSLAFDKTNWMPVYYKKISKEHLFENTPVPEVISEIFYSDLNFEPFDSLKYFSAKAFPKDFIIDENAQRITLNLLDTGSIAPDFYLPRLDDKKFHLSDFRSSLVLIEFSDIGCGHCIAAIDGLIEIANKYKNLQIISIYSRDNKESLKKIVEKKGIQYDVFKGNKEINDKYHVTAVPTFYLIGKDGKIIYNGVGYGDDSKKIFEEQIEKAEK